MPKLVLCSCPREGSNFVSRDDPKLLSGTWNHDDESSTCKESLLPSLPVWGEGMGLLVLMG